MTKQDAERAAEKLRPDCTADASVRDGRYRIELTPLLSEAGPELGIDDNLEAEGASWEEALAKLHPA